ncbi:MAG: hypothetical protein KF886_04680 [Candidatus Hydrogenedentes bacterium]|nr:hypothetical protein [Candidatus Hydrogenedentota bacterium]
MTRRNFAIFWIGAMLVGSLLMLFAVVSTQHLFVPPGALINLLASMRLLDLFRPRRTPFVKEFLVLGLAITLALLLRFPSSALVVTLIFLWCAFLMPLLVIGAAVSERFEARWPLRAVLHLLAPAVGGVLLMLAGFQASFRELEEPPIDVAGDALADKNPPFADTPDHWEAVPMGENTLPGGVDLLEINKSAAVIGLDFAAVEDAEAAVQEKRFASYRDAIDHLEQRGLPWIPSVQMVDQRVKAFSDAAYAAIDLFTQRDAEALGGGRQVFLEGLLEALLENEAAQAAAYVAAALILSGQEPALPPEVAEIAAEMLERFRADEYESKPVGYYAEREELARVFQQNRFCQYNLVEEFDPTTAEQIASGIARVLEDDAALANAYDAILALQSRTTNPPGAGFASLKGYTPGTVGAHFHLALFPPSGSVENALFQRIYDGLPNESIMNRLIVAIRNGEVDLAPDEHSGWYDYQVHALETLLVPERGPEGEKLLLSKAFKERLIEAFRTILTKQRELHVGHLHRVRQGGTFRAMEISPELALEPTATHYLRSARALRFLETAVTAILGEPGYASITLAGGERLAEALPPVAQLLYGLYFQVCEDIGMAPELLAGELTPGEVAAARAQARDWLDNRGAEEVFAADVRYIVPVMANADTTEVRYWMTTGIRLLKVKAEYARPPRLRIDGELLPEDANPGFYGMAFGESEFYLPVEEFAEATGSSAPWTREEFRALCDRAGSHAAITRAVENGRFSGD